VAKSSDWHPYEVPTAGPRAFVARGPSGWLETFPRPAADEALAALLKDAEKGKLDVDAAILAYASGRRGRPRGSDPWAFLDVCRLLATLVGRIRPTDVPAAAAVALWALGDLAVAADPTLGKVDSTNYPLEGTGR
jgi:hypothetical protein